MLNNINNFSNIPNSIITQTNTTNINDTNANIKKQTTIFDSIEEIDDFTMNNIEESVLKYPGYDKNQIIHIDNNPNLINETKVEQNLLMQEIDKKINEENKDELEKQAILDELNNENFDFQFTINTNRPYTPPISELVPVKIENNNVKNNNLISEKDKNEKNLLLNSLKLNAGQKGNVIKDYENLIYDENVGYFFDTKKKIYYDLKQQN